MENQVSLDLRQFHSVHLADIIKAQVRKLKKLNIIM